ncbi:MAG: hypothetical protein U9N80_04975 [Chloroflexota bacterium]|nr:hypothetical protein [Chloroflexota bacterium]
MRFANKLSHIIALLGILILIAACSGPGDNGQASITPTLEQPINPTTAPTAAPDLVYLVNGGDATEMMASRVEAIVTTLSTAAGAEFIVLTAISDNDLEPNAKVVFYLPPDPGLNDIAARFPDVQFVAIGLHGLSAADNLTRIGPDGMGADQVGFIAGVISAVITPDWRVGAISVQNSGEESASNLAFQNGAKFYCGLCRQAYPPFHSYPLGVEAPSSEISAAQDAINALSNLDVDTIFLSPELSAEASAETLEAPGLSFIGGESPVDEIGEKWIVTVRAAPELAIAEIWDQVWVGDGGGTVPMPLLIEDINQERLTHGREAWVQEILQDLINGYIETGVDPITGIAR